MSDIDELLQRISDVNDANLYGLSQLEERIDALERRIEKLESRTAASEGRLDGMSDGVLLRFEAIERRIERIERLLNHKGGGE